MAKPNHDSALGSRPPFPKQQMFVLALCRICEPIAFMSVFPYIYFMVKDFGVAKSEQQIAVYTGMVTSAFAFAEFSASVFWGRLSDRIGRKPVLLIGMAGTAVSMITFGFAPSLPIALLARALGGLLNGNIGVLQTTVAELVTVKEHQPRAYTIMPFVWCIGSILGPVLGGALAQPVKSYPTVFASGTIWDRHPYLLPNVVCTVVVIFSVLTGILFLEETHAEKKYRRDVGLETGDWIISRLRGCADSGVRNEKVDFEETVNLISEDEQPPGYRTTEGSPKISSADSSEPEPFSLNGDAYSRPKPAAGKAFTRQVVLNIVGYGILAYHTMTFDQMLPVFLSTPEPAPDAPITLPFMFSGGFGLNTKQVGYILSVQGFYSMISTVVLFPLVVRRLGALRLFRLLSLTYPLLYLTTPYLSLLPEPLRLPGVYVLAIWKCTYATMAYPSNAILLTNSAPSLLMLGTINGVAASTASLSRAFGPTVSGMLYSAGLRLGCSGLAWWCSAIVTIIGAALSLTMSEEDGRMNAVEKADESIDAEMGDSHDSTQTLVDE